jgi:hypothetical protein
VQIVNLYDPKPILPGGAIMTPLYTIESDTAISWLTADVERGIIGYAMDSKDEQ